MKKIFIIACICGIVGIAQANDTIPIINTVFHGINTLTNLFRPTIVTTVPVVTTPAPVVVTTPPPPPVVVNQPVVQTPVVYVNDPYVYQRPYVYRPVPPPPPRPHHGKHHGGHRPHYRGRR